jgi:serine/threonine protein kinase
MRLTLRAAAAEAPARALDEEWRRGGSIEEPLARCGPGTSVTQLAEMVKADLRRRSARGERPAVEDYLDRFPALRDRGDRMISLIYEEFCLCEERGERPDADGFCRRYAPWGDSLHSQLRYHRLLSQVVTPSPPPRFPELGERFGGFRLRSVLGHGGAARVYLANDEDLGDREVALKVSPDRGDEPSIQGRLDHAHIVPVLSVARPPETGLRGLCMPYRPGLSLDRVIDRVDPAARPRHARVLRDVLIPEGRPESEAFRDSPGWHGFPSGGTYADGVAWVGATLARALGYAHARGILHRDVKPANVLLTLRDGPQLLDFNLAHDPHASRQAEAALRGGTLPYMAPEQLEAFLDPERWQGVGPAADLYSLGLVLRELLTGRRPAAPDPSLPLPRAIAEMLDRRAEPAPSLRAPNPQVPPALDAVIRRCLAADPADRYPSAEGLADDLERLLRRRSRVKSVAAWTRRRGRRIAATLAVVAALLVAREGLRFFGRRLVHQAATLAQKNDGAGAVALYERGCRLDPGLADEPQRAGLDPTALGALSDALGRASYRSGDYAAAYRHYSRAIDVAESQQPPARKEALADLFQRRAWNDCKWGRQAQAARTDAGYEAAGGHFADALSDLAKIQQLGVETTTLVCETIAAQARIGQGDAAAHFQDYRTSVKCYREARDHLSSALKRYPKAPNLAAFLAIVTERLTTVEPRLKVPLESGREVLLASPGVKSD